MLAREPGRTGLYGMQLQPLAPDGILPDIPHYGVRIKKAAGGVAGTLSTRNRGDAPIFSRLMRRLIVMTPSGLSDLSTDLRATTNCRPRLV